MEIPLPSSERKKKKRKVQSNTLQLQHTATRYHTLQHDALVIGITTRNTLQHAATRCITLQHATTRCNTLQHNVPIIGKTTFSLFCPITSAWYMCVCVCVCVCMCVFVCMCMCVCHKCQMWNKSDQIIHGNRSLVSNVLQCCDLSRFFRNKTNHSIVTYNTRLI